VTVLPCLLRSFIVLASFTVWVVACLKLHFGWQFEIHKEYGLFEVEGVVVAVPWLMLLFLCQT
jgi:RsiW-degrading membrane proteinase PrsW (M82 family)